MNKSDPLKTNPSSSEGSPESISGKFVPGIGIWGALAIGVGTMIAAGIFVLSGLAVSNVGTAALVSFVLAAIVACFTATAYAEFSSIYQKSGGGYMYVTETFNSDVTYIMGWTMILGYPASAAFYMASFSEWFHRFMYPVFGIPQAIPFWVPGLIVLAFLVFLNVKGTEESNKFQIVVTSVKIGLIILFLYGGFQGFNAEVVIDSFAENIDHFAQIGLTSALVFITFVGFSAIATNAEEIEDPATTIPRAIYISMGFVTIIYAFVVFVIVFAVNNEAFLRFLASMVDLGGLSPADFVGQNGEVSMGYVAQYYLGDIGFYVIIVGALFSMISATNATILAGSRVKLSMTRHNHLPENFEKLHSRFKTPYQSVLLTGGFITIFIIVFTVIFGKAGWFDLHLGIESVTQFANTLLLIGYSVVNIAIIRSRKKYPDIDRGFKVPLVPYIPILAVIAHIFLLMNISTSALIIALIAELVGVAFWFVWKKRVPSTEEIEAKAPTAASEFTAEKPEEEYRLLVPVANPDHIEPLINTAAQIAREKNGELLLVSIITVPNQTPLSYGRRRVENRKSILKKAQQQAEEAGVPVNNVIRIAHHTGDAIVYTISQHKCDAVLMGWQGHASTRRDVIMGTALDTVVSKADCDILVKKVAEEEVEKPESILLPSGGGPHAQLAAETAASIARVTGASIQLIRVIDPSTSDDDRKDMKENLQQMADEFEAVNAKVSLVEGRNIVLSISKEAEKHDIVMIGATQEGLIQRFLFGQLPSVISQRVSKTIIMAKRKLPAHSRLIELLKKWWRW